jgi:hypothetical protein
MMARRTTGQGTRGVKGGRSTGGARRAAGSSGGSFALLERGSAVLELQRTAGNRATADLLTGQTHHRHLTIPDLPRSRELVAQREDELDDSDDEIEAVDDEIEEIDKSHPHDRPAHPNDEKLQQLVDALKGSPILEMSDEEVQVGLDLWFSGRSGNALDVNARTGGGAFEQSGGFGAGAYGRGAVAKTEQQYPLGLNARQYKALAELGAFVGAEGKWAGQRLKKFGPAYVKFAGSAKGFIGALARAKGHAGFTMVGGIPFPVGFTLGGEAEVFTGVRSSGKADLTLGFDVGSLMQGAGLGADADYAAMAGSESTAKGQLEFDPLRGRIAMSGEVSAFAGAKIQGGVGVKAQLYGQKAVGFKFKGVASTGVGGTAKGSWAVGGGRLHLSLTADGALGVGLGGGADVDADFKPLAVFLWRQVSRARWKAQSASSDPEVTSAFAFPVATLKANVEPKLAAYRDFKIAQLRMGDAMEYVKQHKVQAILDANWPRTLLTDRVKDPGKRARIDQEIVAMLKRVFEEVEGIDVTVDPDVHNGHIRFLQWEPRDLHVLLGGGIEGRHARGKDAAKTNLLSDVGKM